MMALSTAERAQRWRDRQKSIRDAQEGKVRNALKAAYRETFAEWVEHDGNFTSFEISLALAGIDPPQFDDDQGPEAFALNGVSDGVGDAFGRATSDSLGRAEMMIDCLIGAARELAGIVNHYKSEQIKVRLNDLAHGDMGTPSMRKEYLAEIVNLNKRLERLEKPVRKTFPSWED
jgi:hypothetical protein